MASRVVFLGTAEFAVPCLAALHSAHHVVAVVTRPDRPKGRGLRYLPSPVKAESTKLQIPCLTPPRVSTPEFCQKLRELEPDYLVVTAFGEILKPAVLQIPKAAPINVHASLLPRLRGAAPINWAIIRGEPVTGVTTFVMDEGMDTGAMLLQSQVRIDDQMTAGQLATVLSQLAPAVLLETIDRLRAGTLTPTPQEQERATYAPKLKKDDGVIKWDRPAEDLDHLVRGVTPWPGAQSRFRARRLRILKARPSVVPRPDATPGAVLEVKAEGILVAAGAGSALLLETIQPESRRPMDARSFAAGYRLRAGERFGV